MSKNPAHPELVIRQVTDETFDEIMFPAHDLRSSRSVWRWTYGPVFGAMAILFLIGLMQ